ncbi:hypothetical protein [Fulvivirga ligni]|uniref:hypothetical protein n=1 Tax=Fulvivirga ligni TaxID=2904246 RepID=UPI001F248F66|nr:hypothetical protein [Fulvivirga ligni]UII19855.1 hypothetical protein LVD16_18595 [Fulvivirga ligni]
MILSHLTLLFTIFTLSFSPTERINEDMKKLTLEHAKFETTNQKTKNHKRVSLELNQYFTSLTSKITNKSSPKTEILNGIKVKSWETTMDEKAVVMREFSLDSSDYQLYALTIQGLESDLSYLSEKSYGMVNYSIKDVVTSVKKKDRREDFGEKVKDFSDVVERLR